MAAGSNCHRENPFLITGNKQPIDRGAELQCRADRASEPKSVHFRVISGNLIRIHGNNHRTEESTLGS
ncbi:hypothetical protein XENTR_v10007247 [Xenopus tropicalis]|nr:hypothetical protein XENTR_v10007247 [Xenopus tropicalis]